MKSPAEDVRAKLGHPIIDGDGHWIEPVPVFLEYLSEVAGPGAVDRIRDRWRRNDEWYRVGWEERQRKRLRRMIWWGVTSETYDKATALLPKLLSERLPELGIDFAILYPSFGLTIGGILQNDLQKAAARAYNMMTADMFAPYSTQFAPAAIIPCRTPDDALEELDYAAAQRGFKVMMLRGHIERPIAALVEQGIDPQMAALYSDTIALDSPYNYEPLWQKCVEMGLAVTQHAGSPGWVGRASISNFTYNHIGHFADSNHAFARSVFLGGVVRRHPTLPFGFMEGGVSWACQLYLDLIEHWEKRRPAGLQYPTNTDRVKLRQLVDQYGDERLTANADAIMNSLDAFRPECSLEALQQEAFDDFEASGVDSKEDIRSAFARNFYFGCEADDKGTMWAFDPRLGARLHPVFSSDFSHFDVPNFGEVVPEAYEMVERGYLTEQDFRELTFTNAARLHTALNPNFFKGTAVEREVAQEFNQAPGM